MGPKKQGFCSKINCIQMKLLYFVNWHSARASKSAKMVLTKSIFYVKNQLNFFKNNFHFGISIFKRPFFVKTFFPRLNFWTTLLSKIMPNFWWTDIPHRNLLLFFLMSMLILGQKSFFLGPTIFEIPQPNRYSPNN